VMSGAMTAATSENRVWFGSGASAGTANHLVRLPSLQRPRGAAPGAGDGGAPVTVTCTGPVGNDRATVSAYAVAVQPLLDGAQQAPVHAQGRGRQRGFSPIYTVRIGRLAGADSDDDRDVDQTTSASCRPASPAPARPIQPGSKRPTSTRT